MAEENENINENKENRNEQKENVSKSADKENVAPDKKSNDPEENKDAESKAPDESKKEDKNKDELIGDIMANNPIKVDEPQEDDKRAFVKKDVIEEVGFSFMNLNVYLDAQFPTVPSVLKIIFEILSVTSAFLFFPCLMLYIEYGKDSLTQIKEIFSHKNQQIHDVVRFLQIYIFMSISYTIYVIITYLSENILYIALSILTFFDVDINEWIVELLQVLKATSFYSSMSLICFIVFYAYSSLVVTYVFYSTSRTIEHIAVTGLLWYGFLMAITFIEKFFMNFCTSEIRRREFRNRIWDVNYKTFVFKKLVAISTASPSEREEIGETLETDYDPGFFLKHNDLKINTEENAKILSESIFGYLEVTKLTYKDIKKYFPGNYDEVYNYLYGKKFKEDEERPDLTYEEFERRAVELYIERNDMSRTLHDREGIFKKLDLILFTLCLYVSLMAFAILLNIDYKVYLASVGPFVFGVGWVFSDTIKEIYNCFVFLLIRHPYDIGDRVLVDGIEYLVHTTDLLSTTFIDLNGKLCYIPNQVLFAKKIDNIRRSSKQSDLVTIKVGGTTTFQQALELANNIKDKLADHKDFFTGELYLIKFEADGDNVNLGYLIQHKKNFQEIQPRYKRRDVLFSIIEEELKGLHIMYKNSFALVS